MPSVPVYLLAVGEKLLATVNRPSRAIPLLIALSLLWLSRQPEWTSFTTLYIDDGFFVNYGLNQGIDLLAQHSGYLHILPRLIGEIVALFPLQYAPVVIACLTWLVIAATMLTVWWTLRSSSGVVSRYAFFIAGTMAIFPLASTETVAVAACLQWHLLGAAIVVLALGDLNRRSVVPVTVLVLAVTTSAPLAIVVAPSVAVMAYRARDDRRVAVLPVIAYLVGFALQIAVVVRSYEPAGPASTLEVPFVSGTTIASFLEMTGPLPLLGAPITRLIVGAGFLAITLAWALSVLALFLASRVITSAAAVKSQKALFQAALVLLPGVAIVMITLALRPAVRTLAIGNPGGTRYSVPLAYVMWVIVVIALVALLSKRGKSKAEILLGGASCACAAVLVVVGWTDSLGRADGKPWPEASRQACAWAQQGDVVSVPIAPPPWIVGMPCDSGGIK